MPADLRGEGAVSVLGDTRDEIGEGPIWDDRGECLLRVDIGRRRLIALRPRDQGEETVEVPGEVSAVVLRESGGLLVAVDRRILGVDDVGCVTETVAVIDDCEVDVRLNDCRCDPQGRIWAGTLHRSGVRGGAALYRIDAGGRVERAVDATTLSNGIGWSSDGERMYFVDSVEQRVDVFDFDGKTGEVSDRRVFASISPEVGLPDGVAVDSEGGVWVCVFGGGEIRRYDADGSLSSIVPLPATNPSCPAFGGPGLETLFVTTTRHRLSPVQLRREPVAGAVLAFEPGIAGVAAWRFAG